MESTTLNSRDLYFRLLSHVRPYWRTFMLSVAGLVVSAMVEPAVAALFKPLLDANFVQRDPTGLVWMPLAMVGLFLVKGISSYTAEMAMAWVAGKVVLDLRVAMFDRLLSLPTLYYDLNPSGSLISKVNYDVRQVSDAATHVVTVLVRDSLTVLGLLGWMLYLNWRLTLVTFLIAPIIVAVIWIINRRIRQMARSIQKSYGEMTRVLQEATEGNRVIKVFGGQAYEAGRFHETSNWVRRYMYKAKAASSLTSPLALTAVVCGLAVIVYVASKQAAAGVLTPGGFVSFIGAMGLLMSPIKRLTNVNEKLQKGLAAAESVFGLMDEPTEADEGRRCPDPAQGQVAFENVSFGYDRGAMPALRNFSLTLEPGETVALVGPSGSGKSTVASLLPRFYDIVEGTLRLDGRDVRDMALADLRANISLVSQDVTLFNDTVAANIAYGCTRSVDPAEIARAAESANALEFIERLPKRFDTIIGDRGIRLSGGQRQRLAIARALFKNAPILVLDEATSALDSESERRVQEALDHLRQGRTTLVIAHRLSTIEQADRIIVLKDGRIEASGTHAELLAEGGLYADLYRIQFSPESARDIATA
jgi:subfamily B ATP-binding cassette protein MsbA